MNVTNDFSNLQRKVEVYKEILKNTEIYRQRWRDGLKTEIREHLTEIAAATGLQGQIDEREELDNLGAVIFNLGTVKSGMSHEVAENIRRDLIKQNGSLIYQQLFNGKILVLINYPFIENYGQPAPPKTIGIYRPEELKAPFYVRHLETFVQEVTHWEDYDDDDNGGAKAHQQIGFHANFDGPQ
ncbi:MAG: hypothetical protein R2787_07865 [Saprospiraceae bacterium]|nr:hypothetical protein [Saprospiraceae bacterium]MCB9314408.1 hypothetical protein [Lewinellaceae bacterium]HRW76836.1 hypothetical protein [Saprospiraceae bacterium]